VYVFANNLWTKLALFGKVFVNIPSKTKHLEAITKHPRFEHTKKNNTTTGKPHDAMYRATLCI
jgi:hypothetical protein